MAAITTIIAGIAAAAAVAGTATSIISQQKARAAAGQQRQASEKAQAEQKAAQAQAAAQERRQQVREERVRRARVMQASENTGTAFSSGEAGAVGNLATNLSSNLGLSLGGEQRGQAISGFNQQAANFGYNAQEYQGQGAMAASVANMSGSIFGAAGGFGSLQKGYNSIFGNNGFDTNTGIPWRYQ